MRHYRATELATGVVAEYDADLPQDEHLTAAFTLEDIVPTTPSPDADPAPYMGPWKITKLAFRNRFTQAEKVGIELASLDNADAPMAQRQMAAALRAAQADQRDAKFIDLKRKDTRDGTHVLETYGLLAAGRATVILDTIPAAEELFDAD